LERKSSGERETMQIRRESDLFLEFEKYYISK
jgi:hypothetical protein